MNRAIGVLLAGGLGTRLWPWSRQDRPKQFLPLMGTHSLVRTTWNRLTRLAVPDRCLVLTNSHLLGLARQELPELIPQNLIGEPRSCNTSACLALAAALAAERWGEGCVLVVMSSDHFIGDDEHYTHLLKVAVDSARDQDALITLGIAPTRPDTGYGYLECSASYSDLPPETCSPLVRFHEKPTPDRAVEYLESGRFLWNMGNFVWRAEVILAEYARQVPDLYRRVKSVADLKGTQQAAAIESFYRDLPEGLCQSIDFAIMEHAQRVLVLPVPVAWDDLGSWGVLRRLRESELDSDGNLSLLRHVALDTSNTLVVGSEPEVGVVATIGVSDLVIVRAGPNLLVARAADLDQMRAVVSEMADRGWNDAF